MQLGEGGMGEVYRAHDPRLGRDVAIKMLRAAVASDPERLALFEREARAVAALTHPNIVTLYSIEETDSVPFLTMELVVGFNLERLVESAGLPLPRLLDIAIPLAMALVAAHDRGVVHRDLKPANVMVTRDGIVKVLDFGLAKLTSPVPNADSDATIPYSPDLPSLSVPGRVMGTLPYMSPEQLRGEPADARADIFAFGAILYELATGRRPFAGATSADVISAILRDAPNPTQGLRGDLPGDLHRIITRCLEKDTRARFQTALDVSNELRLVNRTIQSAAAPTPPPPTSVRSAVTPSIAVLPFANHSSDAGDEYFSDGLADELLGVLAKVRGLRVAARASSFHFKGKNEDPAVIGQKLNVATLLDGSVRKAGNRVRIAVQLVKVADGDHLWSETYDRTLDDVFAVQDDIAQSVVKQLRTTLLGETAASAEAEAEIARAVKGRTRNPESHRLYLQGRYFTLRLTRDDLSRGIALLRRAIEVDPRNAAAWSSLSWAETVRSGFGYTAVEESIQIARDAAMRALEIDPDLADAHVALGTVNLYYLDWAGAEKSLKRAERITPDNPEVLCMLGAFSSTQDRLDESIAYARRAVDIDPLSIASYIILIKALRHAGRAEEAESACRFALSLGENTATLHMGLGFALRDQGRLEEALAAVQEEKADWARLCGEALVYHSLGREEESVRALQSLIEVHAGDAAVQVALVFAVRGEADEAFAWLDRALAQHDSGLGLWRSMPEWQAIHADPRWPAFLRRLGFVTD